nr:hypothetical protein [Burkholderiales bacterium]
GWARYVVVGRAWRKPFAKLRRARGERHVRGLKAREILDRVAREARLPTVTATAPARRDPPGADPTPSGPPR